MLTWVYRTFLIGIQLFILGCVTAETIMQVTEENQKKLDAWAGKSDSQLTMIWGAPTNQTETKKGKVFTYIQESETTFYSSTSTTTAPGSYSYGNTYTSGSSGEITTTHSEASRTDRCTINWFFNKKSVIASHSFVGNFAECADLIKGPQGF